MPRLFIGLSLPELVVNHLQLMTYGLPQVRWQTPEQFHLTLSFLGNVDGGKMRSLVDALATLKFSPLSLALKDVGVFPLRGKPRCLWVGVEDQQKSLQALRQRIDRIVDPLEIAYDRRKLMPHVVLARFHDTPLEPLKGYLQAHALFRSESFTIDKVKLFSSILAPKGSKYCVEAAFPLTKA